MNSIVTQIISRLAFIQHGIRLLIELPIREVHFTLSAVERLDFGKDSGNLKYANTNDTKESPPQQYMGANMDKFGNGVNKEVPTPCWV